MNVDLGLEIQGGLGGVRRFSHEAMATVFEVYAEHPDHRYASQAAQAAFDLADRLEHDLSRFIPNSDVGRINNLAAGKGTRVSASTLECLLIARHIFDLTGGAFDVALGTGLAMLELDPDLCVVSAAGDGVQVDLGGIGKGYAVDLMAELLEEWEVGTALVHGGYSSVLALAPPARGDGWLLTLSDPADASRVLARLSVHQTALGASGLRKGDHILDPRTGKPVRRRSAAWVAVPRRQHTGAEHSAAPRAGAVADALTTAFMILNVDEIEGLCRRNPDLEAWILANSDGTSEKEAGVLHFGGAAG